MSDYWDDRLKYHELDSMFPVDESFESIHWLESRDFERKAPIRWEKRYFIGGIPVEKYRMTVMDGVFLSVNAFREVGADGDKTKWFVRVAKEIPNSFSTSNYVDSGKHSDVRDCLMEIMKNIEKFKSELKQIDGIRLSKDE